MKKFKDFSIQKKLTSGFAAMIVLLLVIGLIGAFGMYKIAERDTHLYEDETKPLEEIYDATRNLLLIRSDILGATAYESDAQKVEQYYQSYLTNKKEYEETIPNYIKTVQGEDSLALYAEADKILQEIYYPGAEKIFAALKRGDGNDARFTIQEITDDVDIVYSNFDKMVDNRMADVKDTSDENGVISSTLLIILAILVVLGITIGIFLARRISQMIGTPINRVVEAAGQIALGRVDVNLTDVDAKDETGQLADAFTNMLEGMSV